jgi:hypothetical protein
VALNATVLSAPSSLPTWCRRSIAGGEDDVGALARARRAVSSPMRAPADHDDGLAEQLLPALGLGAGSCRVHATLRAACAGDLGMENGERGDVDLGEGRERLDGVRSTSSGTRARIASVACCNHSPASGPSA